MVMPSTPACSQIIAAATTLGSGARRVHRLAVNAASHATPNSPDFVNHTKAVAHDRDFARRVMIPSHGNLTQPQAGEVSEIDPFHVKTKAFDLRGLDQRPAHVHAKGFEAALRVPVRQAGRRANDEIENAPALFASPRLMCAKQAASGRPRTKLGI